MTHGDYERYDSIAEAYEVKPTVPPLEQEAFDPPTDRWVNCWDHNPFHHGGRFVRYNEDRQYWKIVEVTPPSAHPLGDDGEDVWVVETVWVDPDDVWEDPKDPLTEFTDNMVSILGSLQDLHHLPNAPAFLENVTYYAADMTHRVRGSTHEEFSIPTERHLSEEELREKTRVEAWWGELARFDVDPENVENVAESDLPRRLQDDD